MPRKVKNINLQAIKASGDGETHYADEHFFITMHDLRLGGIETGKPYRVDEGRVMMVTRGWVRVIVNLEEQRPKAQSVVVLMPDSIFEILEWSEDFDMKAFSFKELPFFTPMRHQISLALTDDEWLLASEYVGLIWHEVQRKPVQKDVVEHLQTAFLLEMTRIVSQRDTLREKTATRQDKLFRRFLELIKKHGLEKRKIEFYADKLCITQGHLGAVVKKASGLTVMQWLNRHAVQRAKVLLRYSDQPIWEIAERLGFANPSFFSKFFKKETGITPGEYRNTTI